MSEYRQMLREVGVFVKHCASDRYSSGCCWYIIHEMSAKSPVDSCPITDPALNLRDADAVIWGGEYLSARPGDEPSLWFLDRLPTNTTDARDTEATHLGAAMHAALGRLGLQVRLRVTEKGGVFWVPCTDGATITWALDRTMRETSFVLTTRRCARYPPLAAAFLQWFRGTAGRGCGAGRFHRHLPNKFCQGHPSPLRRALIPAAAPHRRMSTWLHPRSISRERRRKSIRDAPTGNGVISPNDTAGAPQEAEKKSDLPDNDDVAADGVTSVVGQSLGDKAVSEKAGGSAAATGPKGPDAADDAQGRRGSSAEGG
ncbi:hypothetical protein Tc00.1047053506609.50 [Trypanosoma cruzi]|uniref:Uncharacterized protein n=1 Tax=Trypanosoma cruzi (strain CL Brener) TaxID=353153 RepID=Q4CZ99_TRYCC|nr:hypothetical protein Tc00.1047053506609.50 [Trypanosoma cruzi]EAN85600.1 hypothetical protein Tc00.1047053506609.50 [Trypanosoma cruzi]|eukprot:XP_807451.1 hypothetical protein [Trypanosoma cruzi strain CL Brener]